MKKIETKISSYIFIILLSLVTSIFYSDNTYYLGVKYITTFRAIDIMYSLLFTFLFFKVFLDNYYFYVLNRKNIITRIGRKKYNVYILKKIIKNSSILLFINLIIDLILIHKINFIYTFLNVFITTIFIIFLPKRKEYDYELLVILILGIMLKVLIYWLAFYSG